MTMAADLPKIMISLTLSYSNCNDNSRNSKNKNITLDRITAVCKASTVCYVWLLSDLSVCDDSSAEVIIAPRRNISIISILFLT